MLRVRRAQAQHLAGLDGSQLPFAGKTITFLEGLAPRGPGLAHASQESTKPCANSAGMARHDREDGRYCFSVAL